MTDRYFVVREDILPEAIVKTLLVKDMLQRGEAATVHEATERAGLSRSAFYKYKDGIFAVNQLDRERLITVSMDLEHRSGVLSKVLGLVAGLEANVLTINQSIPLQGQANVVLSVDTSPMTQPIAALIEQLRMEPGVRKAAIIGQG
ncbi:ACT domain-containing protein [Paenibacillus sp. IB182496]|uniref:UPF0735 ACT domain-containing protein IDH44_05315 n=1 Tax=Paenibacillus sabuli TaxID=2772509 RepID=A0A927BRZ9_9BACL|nr:ACT domain-containing protein [Paenibacillus sabuli]MBD2844600.1 ACT domain-containing protein [Paenibacillus sabuli]